MTPLDILPIESKYMVMVLAGTALAIVISMTVGQMALEMIYCSRQNKTQGTESE